MRRTRIFEAPLVEGWAACNSPSSRPGSRVSQGEAEVFGECRERTGTITAAALPTTSRAIRGLDTRTGASISMRVDDRDGCSVNQAQDLSGPRPGREQR